MKLSYEVFHRDVGTIVDFYVDVLGFRALEAPTPTDYRVVVRDDIRIGCCHHTDADPAPRRPPLGSEIVLRVADVHTEHARVLAHDWPLADPLTARPWGMTDFRVFDPTGQYLRITDGTMGS